MCLPPPINNKVKCKLCKKTIPKNNIVINCFECKNSYHSKCAGISFDKYNKCDKWNCNGCVDKTMPFASLDNNELFFTIEGKTIPSSDDIKLSPSFTIQSLLDKIPGNITIQTDDFLSDTINSKYYTAK